MEDDSDDDVPIAELRRKKTAAAKQKKKKVVKEEDEEEEEEPPKKKAKKAPAAKKGAASSQKKKPTTKASSGAKKKPSSSSNGAAGATAKKKKELSQLQRVEEASKTFEWWTVPELPEGQVFRTLEHKGVAFAAEYVPHGVKMLYGGEEVDLSPEEEEVATHYASMPEDGPQLSETGGQRETFQKNFFEDFRAVLGKSSKIKSFAKCDFRPISEYLQRLRSAKKAASDAEKRDAKALKESEQLRYGYALLDGRLQKVGNFRMEPPSLFRGRGKHPKTGTLKQRTHAERVAINVGACNVPPRCEEPGHAWGSIQHDDTVTWLSSWHENVMSQNKYVMLAANSSLKGKSDFQKFEKAQMLKGCIDKVRHDYRANLKSSDTRVAQLATTMWLIDVYALRVGGEKGEDEADTVGCCSLRVEHFTFNSEGKDVVLEFLGKDSMLFKQTIDFASFGDEHSLRVYDNIVRFCKRKKPQQEVFDTITPPELNAHLSSIMPGLTAKVFRTYNASETLQNELPSAAQMKKLDTVGGKVVAYNEANRSVAILCNHQRTVSAATQAGLDAISDRLEALQSQKKELQSWKKAVGAGKKIPLKSDKDPMPEAAALVEAAKKMKNDAKTVDEKIDATKAYEEATEKRRTAQKHKFLHMHEFNKQPTAAEVDKRIATWTEKIKTCEIQVRNKSENKEVSLGTSKANYCDPRISVAWCKRCDVPLEKIFPKTLMDKFAWAMAVGPDWRWEAVALKNTAADEDVDEQDDD